MRSLIYYIILPMLAICSCRSNKESVVDNSRAVDSVARSATHRSFASLDSLMANIDFRFDTLKVNIERPSLIADAPPEVIRLTAINGRVVDQKRLNSYRVEEYNRADTVSYKQSAARSSTQTSATTRLYNPPDGTAVAIIGIIIIILIIIFIAIDFRNKNNAR
ncbi:MAG: hypothetical protein J1E33_05600 [Alistipes sp.]|nr:hypothetical protein [Alistipes sp.]